MKLIRKKEPKQVSTADIGILNRYQTDPSIPLYFFECNGDRMTFSHNDLKKLKRLLDSADI